MKMGPTSGGIVAVVDFLIKKSIPLRFKHSCVFVIVAAAEPLPMNHVNMLFDLLQ